MKLILLGTSGYHPTDDRQTACLMLPEIGWLLDAGTAMFRIRPYLQTDQLDIFLTHAHLDHIIGLTYLFSILAGPQAPRTVRVHGLAATLQAAAEHLFAPALFPALPPLTWVPLQGPVAVPGGGTLDSFPLQHPGGSIGYRLDLPSGSLAYVTDTTADPQADYVDRIRGVDLLIHECFFPDGKEQRARETGHSCASQVARVAQQAGVRRLVLTHLHPLEDPADPVGIRSLQAIFPQTTIGTDGLSCEF